MKRMVQWATVAGLLTLGACTKKSENPPPGPASGSVAPPATDSASPPPAQPAPPPETAAGSGSAVDVPTEMDFEDQASTKITDKNVEAQVKAIEQELKQN